MLKAILAWIVFFGGFAIEIGIDHLLRIQDQNIRTGGIPELWWFVIQAVLGITAISIAYTVTKSLERIWKRFLVVGIQVAIGFVLYVYMGLYYVVGSGIDSL